MTAFLGAQLVIVPSNHDVYGNDAKPGEKGFEMKSVDLGYGAVAFERDKLRPDQEDRDVSRLRDSGYSEEAIKTYEHFKSSVTGDARLDAGGSDQRAADRSGRR
jgi:hypothetical protein